MYFVPYRSRKQVFIDCKKYQETVLETVPFASTRRSCLMFSAVPCVHEGTRKVHLAKVWDSEVNFNSWCTERMPDIEKQ